MELQGWVIVKNETQIEATGDACLIFMFTFGKRKTDFGKSRAVNLSFVLCVSHKISVYPAYILFKVLFLVPVKSSKLIIHYKCLQLLKTYFYPSLPSSPFLSSYFLSLFSLCLSLPSFILPFFLQYFFWPYRILVF